MTEETTTIRIAIPSELPGGLDAQRAGHFGRCACFTLVDVDGGEVRDVEVLQNAPHTEGGCMAPVLVLAEHNVDAIVVARHRRTAAHGLQPGRHRRPRRRGRRRAHHRRRVPRAEGFPMVGMEHACQH